MRRQEALDAPELLPETALPPDAPRDALQFFNEQQARALDAVLSRLLPGDEDDPGAREAGVLYYIDHLLATHSGYAEKTYTMGPYPRPYEGDEPPEDNGDVIWVPEDELERYGWQSPFVPREIYEMGLARLDALARERFGGDFVELDDEQQDVLLEAVEDDEDDDVAEVFDELSAGDFFDLLLTHTHQGFLADPVYGGNRDMVGWRLIGFPGAQRAYTPQEMLDEDFHREPQSLLDLPPFHAHHDEEADEPLITVRKRHPLGPVD